MSSPTRKTVRLGVLLLVLVAAIVFKISYEPSYEGLDGPYDLIEGKVPNPWELDDPAGTERKYNSRAHGVSREEWTAPESHWLSNDRKIAEQRLTGQPSTILIIPVQGDKNAFDLAERSLMTRMISDQIAADSRNTIVDVTAVTRYLGINHSSYQKEDILRLRMLTRSPQILLLHAEHDRSGNWVLEAELRDQKFREVARPKKWTGLKYSDEKPPSVALRELVGEIAKFAGGSARRPEARTASFNADDFPFPESIDDMVQRSSPSSLHAAAYLQMLAVLHPTDDPNESRRELFERSLVELENVTSESDYHAYFTARAYFHLGRRPAAVVALSDPSNSHEEALLEFLNGNLPDLQAYAQSMGTDVLGFMYWRDLQWLEAAYEQERVYDAYEKLEKDNENWAPFINRALRDFELWATYSAAEIKLGLENLVPIGGLSIAERLSKLIVTGGLLSEREFTQLLFRHIDTVAAQFQQSEHAVGDSPALQQATLDVLDLARSVATANHIERVRVELEIRDRQNAAMEEIVKHEPLFAGHPVVTLLKGRIQAKMAEDVADSQRESLFRMSAETKLNGFSWTGSMTPDAAEVARTYQSLLFSVERGTKPSNRGRAVLSYSRRYFEWPRTGAWLSEIPHQETRYGVLESCLKYRVSGFPCVTWLIEQRQRGASDPDKVRADLMAAYEDRFDGHPKQRDYAVLIARSKDDRSEELELLRSHIEAGSENWMTYRSLGLLLLGQDNYSEAQKVWLSYPGFDDPAEDKRLDASNNAGYAGSQLYWVGQYELAEALFNLSLSFRTGSGEYMSAGQRISLIHGDLESAGQWAAARVRRYQSTYGMRDLIQILHVSGESELATGIFDDAVSGKIDNQAWLGELVGHHVNSWSIDDVATWIASLKESMSAIPGGTKEWRQDYLAHYLLLFGSLDRAPDDNFASKVDDAHVFPQQTYHHGGEFVDEATGKKRQGSSIVSGLPGPQRHDQLMPTPQDEKRIENGAPVVHRMTRLARAMTGLAGEDYEQAFNEFNEVAYFWYLNEFLPYYALAAAEVGQTDQIRVALAERETKLETVRKRYSDPGRIRGYRFDEDLTYAVLASYDGEHEEAVRLLRRALNTKPFMDARAVFPMYQIVFLADHMYERTGENVYKDFALDFSRRHTVILPMYAWAYYIVAKYSPSQDERIRNAASALKLDPLSIRVDQLPVELIKAAKEHLDRRGPPYLDSPIVKKIEST